MLSYNLQFNVTSFPKSNGCIYIICLFSYYVQCINLEVFIHLDKFNGCNVKDCKFYACKITFINLDFTDKIYKSISSK